MFWSNLENLIVSQDETLRGCVVDDPQPLSHQFLPQSVELLRAFARK